MKTNNFQGDLTDISANQEAQIRELTVPMCGYNYVAYMISWMLGKAPISSLTQSDSLEIEHNTVCDSYGTRREQ